MKAKHIPLWWNHTDVSGEWILLMQPSAPRQSEERGSGRVQLRTACEMCSIGCTAKRWFWIYIDCCAVSSPLHAPWDKNISWLMWFLTVFIVQNVVSVNHPVLCHTLLRSSLCEASLITCVYIFIQNWKTWTERWLEQYLFSLRISVMVLAKAGGESLPMLLVI